ncbi:hypothetical protein CS0771_04320 [Catellatospora sp. IY07-71]|uniref:DUF4350 domain-containing protein n=1 Tax=Catellatospora sp. IY07-71 TaxID=2728827 RepID=UPI001BB45EB9|nr:DUF4350 domain-containing protein [Catellatospora sp. IY07-71]BCJ70888.1 hypothetical protein CS0771_04320 [Catellatospora sp. IY07-71]
MSSRADRRRRWRLLVPFLPVLALLAVTLTAHAVEEPDPDEPAYLSPTGDGPDGARRLAELLAAEGVTIRTVTASADAVRAVGDTAHPVTLFVPAPQFLHRTRLSTLAELPEGTRVVLVEPGGTQVSAALDSVGLVRRRWAAAVRQRGADCALTTADRAAALRNVYAEVYGAPAPVQLCFDGGLARVRESGGPEFVLVGSADPFRAARIDEHGNARLAVDLLSTHRTLIWLDLHQAEPPPPRPRTPRGERPQQSEPDREPGPSPYPDWLFWVVLTLLAATLTVALAKGRRLGPPAVEALPVEVPGAETALGRGRLYRRAKARGPALETLRADARRRVAAAVGLPPATGPEELLPALHARTGLDPTLTGGLLFGPEPQTDEELHQWAGQLRLLVERVTAGTVNEGEHR